MNKEFPEEHHAYVPINDCADPDKESPTEPPRVTHVYALSRLAVQSIPAILAKIFDFVI